MMVADQHADSVCMVFDPRSGQFELPGGAQRRKCGRLELEGLKCTLGTVADLSASGMRVIGRAVPKETIEVRIVSREVDFVVGVSPVWSRKVGFMRHEMGLEFVDLDEETRRCLTQLATVHRIRRAI
jgi:hypothetical protein